MTVENNNGQEAAAAAYEVIMDAIITQKLAPDQKISEHILSDMFDVTRSAARSIIEQLTAQKFLVSVSPRVTRVAPLTLSEIKQNFVARKMLEPQIFALAAPLIDKTAIAQLKDQIHHEGLIEDDATALRLLKTNKESNLYVVEQVNYPILVSWVSQLEDMAMRIYWLYFKISGALPFSMSNQQAFAELMLNGDAEGVHKQCLLILNSCEEQIIKAIFTHNPLNKQNIYIP